MHPLVLILLVILVLALAWAVLPSIAALVVTILVAVTALTRVL